MPQAPSPQVKAFKCADTGQLFEDEKAFRKHRRAYLAAQRRNQAKAALADTLKTLRERIRTAATVPEIVGYLDTIFREHQACRRGSPYDRKYVAVRLLSIEPLTLNQPYLYIRLEVFQTKKGSFNASCLHELNSVPGMFPRSATPFDLPPDAPVKAGICARYDVTLNLDKLTGLAATRDAILNARTESWAHQEQLKKEAELQLLSNNREFQYITSELAALKTAIIQAERKLHALQENQQRFVAQRRALLTQEAQALLVKNPGPPCEELEALLPLDKHALPG